MLFPDLLHTNGTPATWMTQYGGRRAGDAIARRGVVIISKMITYCNAQPPGYQPGGLAKGGEER